MKNGRMQAKDITTLAFVQAVIVCGIKTRSRMTMRWDVQAVLAGHPDHVGRYDIPRVYPNLPEKVVMAKAEELMAAGVIDGCDCGCRGDYEVMPGTAAALGLVPFPGDGGGSHEPYGFWVLPEMLPAVVSARGRQSAGRRRRTTRRAQVHG